MKYQLTEISAIGSGLGPVAMRLVAASVLALSIAGCRDGIGDGRMIGFVEPVQSYQERHPIVVEKGDANLALDVPSSASGLNVYQKDQIRHFIGLWRNEGAGKLVVSASGREQMADLTDILIERVIPRGSLHLEGWHGGKPGVKLSFVRYVAQGPDCGAFPSSLSEDHDNVNYENYGCAAQHNLAAMIANPRDLIEPRDTVDWRDGDRRDTVYRNFWHGQTTGAEVSNQEKAGNISDVAKQ